MLRLDLYWQSDDSWWHYDERCNRVLNDDAPEEARKSYDHYLQQLESDAL